MSKTIRAVVIVNEARECKVRFSEYDPSDYSDTILFELPCITDEQAWAICDAFNHPESNKNNWRELSLQ